MDRKYWFHTSVDKLFENPVGDTKQRYWAIALRVLLKLLRLCNCDYQCSFPDFGNFESAQAGRKKAKKPGL